MFYEFFYNFEEHVKKNLAALYIVIMISVSLSDYINFNFVWKSWRMDTCTNPFGKFYCLDFRIS